MFPAIISRELALEIGASLIKYVVSFAFEAPEFDTPEPVADVDTSWTDPFTDAVLVLLNIIPSIIVVVELGTVYIFSIVVLTFASLVILKVFAIST